MFQDGLHFTHSPYPWGGCRVTSAPPQDLGVRGNTEFYYLFQRNLDCRFSPWQIKETGTRLMTFPLTLSGNGTHPVPCHSSRGATFHSNTGNPSPPLPSIPVHPPSLTSSCTQLTVSQRFPLPHPNLYTPTSFRAKITLPAVLLFLSLFSLTQQPTTELRRIAQETKVKLTPYPMRFS